MLLVMKTMSSICSRQVFRKDRDDVVKRVDTESRDDMTTLTEEPDCERFVSRVSQLSAGEAEVLNVLICIPHVGDVLLY